MYVFWVGEFNVNEGVGNLPYFPQWIKGQTTLSILIMKKVMKQQKDWFEKLCAEMCGAELPKCINLPLSVIDMYR